TPTRRVLKSLLTRRGFEVTDAGSIAEARRLAEKDARFEVVVSDLGLPDGDGCELLEELKSRQPGLIGIALSGYGMDEDIARTKKAGFTKHLTKPVVMEALDEALNAAGATRPAAKSENGNNRG